MSKKYLKKSLALYPQLDYEPLLNLIFIAYKEKDKINLLAYAKQLIHEYPYIAKNYLLLYSLYPDSRPAIDRIHLLNNYFKYVGHRYNPETLAELATLYLLIGDHKKAKEINTFLKTCTHSDT